MYHVKITDDDGRVVTESDGEALVLLHKRFATDGVRCVTLYDGAKTDDLFEIILSLDDAQNTIMSHNPALKIMYAIKDELIEGREEIDLTHLREVLE